MGRTNRLLDVLKGGVSVETEAKAIDFVAAASFDVTTDSDKKVTVSVPSLAAFKNRFTIISTRDASVSTNEFLAYTERLSPSDVNFLVPFACTIREITLYNQNNNCQGDIKIRKNSLVSTPDYVWSFDTGASSPKTYVTGVNLSLAAGDWFSIQYTKTGGSTLADLGLVLFLEG